MRTVTADERRARLARRHHLAPGHAAPDAVAAAASLVGLHATDPTAPFLSARARVPGLGVADVEAALYDDGTLVKHLAMRRTVFVVPTDLAPVVQVAVSDAVAATQRSRLVAEVEGGGVARDGRRWLARAERDTLAALAELGEATGAQLSRAVPALRATVTYAEGKAWGGEVGVATRVLTVLGAEGRIVRGRPAGSWTSSQHRWRLAPERALPDGLGAAEARAELVGRWLAAFAPATEADVAWWTGLGLRQVRPALAAVGAVEVDLGGGEVGLVLPGDVGPVGAPAPWAALLPALDPTTMGWKGRSWYLGDHGPALFDRNGNAGPSVWWGGRIVGGWAQRPGGAVVHRLLEDVGGEGRAAVEAEAAALEAWLGGVVVKPRFGTPLARELAATP